MQNRLFDFIPNSQNNGPNRLFHYDSQIRSLPRKACKCPDRVNARKHKMLSAFIDWSITSSYYISTTQHWPARHKHKQQTLPLHICFFISYYESVQYQPVLAFAFDYKCHLGYISRIVHPDFLFPSFLNFVFIFYFQPFIEKNKRKIIKHS